MDHGIFRLDAHYAGTGTSGNFDSFPIIEELKLIMDWNKPALIVIDDINKFGSKHNCKNQPDTGYLYHSIDWSKYSVKKI